MTGNGPEVRSRAHDIALLKISSSVPKQDVLPLCGDRSPRHSKLVAIGMGLNETWTNWDEIVERFENGAAVIPEVLQEVELKENEDCFDRLPGNFKAFVLSIH